MKILFVCHGNICRSPMAEFIMKDMVKKAGREKDFEIASVAASHEEDGADIYGPARRELEKHGVAWNHRRARRITPADYAHFDHIFYMDSRNARYLRQLFPKDNGKLRKLLSRDVADPWYTGDFTKTWEDIFLGCQKIMEEFS